MLILFHLTIIITTLEFWWNKIGENGIQHLTGALKNNVITHQVSSILSSDTHRSHRHPTILDLRKTRIGDEEAQCLAYVILHYTVIVHVHWYSIFSNHIEFFV